MAGNAAAFVNGFTVFWIWRLGVVKRLPQNVQRASCHQNAAEDQQCDPT
jgi:hypothetical protein